MAQPSLSTKTGDKGTTGLIGGQRISKSSPRLHAYGTVDELNAQMGLILAEDVLTPELREQFTEIQRMLFVMGSDLATPLEAGTDVPRVTEEHIQIVERWGADLEQALPALQKFVLPSGHRAGALMHQARTVCRRAERWTVDLSEKELVSEHVLIYLNRLSDYLFLAARTVNKLTGVAEVEWEG